MRVLLWDRNAPATRYHSRFETIFGCRNGLFSPLERARLRAPDAVFVYAHPDLDYEALAAAHLGATAAHEAFDALFRAGFDDALDLLRAQFDLTLDSQTYAPGDTLARLGAQIGDDLILLKETRGSAFRAVSQGDVPAGVHIIGGPFDVLAHKQANIFPGTIFDCATGPIIIDDGAIIGQFSFIQGPAYIGPGAQVDNCRVLGSVIGRQNRVGGEIECSLFGDFSNKHHEGFIGHSFVGNWVNLGALTTTSDLKNNYGSVRLGVPEAFFAGGAAPLIPVETGAIKFGSIIGDCVKTAIGTKINTGSVIDVGGNIFDMKTPKYVAPFTWGGQGDMYALEKFLSDCKTIFARRDQTVSDTFAAMARNIWTRCHE